MAAGYQPLHPLRFSPDGKFAYVLDSQRIFRFDENARTKTALSSPLPKFVNGILSSDARWWCYIADSNKDRTLLIHDLVTNETRMLVPSLFLHHPWSWRISQPHYCFSPDCKFIYISYGGKIHRINVLTGQDDIVPFRADVRADLGPFLYFTSRVTYDTVRVKCTRSADASPDGRHLVFSALGKIYQMDLHTGKSRQLVSQAVNQFQPVYSPDGQWIAYVSWCDTTGGGLWRVRAEGGQPTRLTTTQGQYQYPAWAPDGESIAVVRGNLKDGFLKFGGGGTGQVEVVSVNNDRIQIVADSVPLINRLAFSADGHKVIYAPKRTLLTKNGFPVQLVAKDIAGGESEVLAVGKDLPDWFDTMQKTLSPDGRFIVCSVDEDLYLVPVSLMQTPTVLADGTQRLSVLRFAAGLDPYWEKGGKVLAWSYGNKFYRINPDKVLAAGEKANYGGDALSPAGRYFLTVKVAPDEVIDLHVSIPSQYGRGTVALTGVRIISMQGEKVTERGSIVIKDGRILSLGEEGTVPIPRDAKVLDLPGTTVMPGFVDLHLHLHFPAEQFPQQHWSLLTNLAFGVTTARDPSSTFDSYSCAEMLQTGQMLGPRLYTVGRPVRTGDGVIGIDNFQDALAVVQKRAALGSNYLKYYLHWEPHVDRQWAVIACREAGLNMTNEGLLEPFGQLAMIKDGSTGIEHSPLWGDPYQDMILFYAHSQTYLTPTLQVTYALGAFYNDVNLTSARDYFISTYWNRPQEKLTRFPPGLPGPWPVNSGVEGLSRGSTPTIPDTSLLRSFIATSSIYARIRKAGGRVVLGSHGDDEGVGVHDELWALQMGGLTNMEALQAATIMGAEALGIQKDVGSLETGKIADLLILNKNPLEDIHNSLEIRYVMKGGIIYDGNTLDEIWPVAKKCPEWRIKGLKEVSELSASQREGRPTAALPCVFLPIIHLIGKLR